ncbi:MAG: SH3 domain-containing protein [Hyphomicrobium sp.]|uniref:SH3 domain-containing protein n=1 Tax=Hyphomicrobium sp. TaxID=82 RepID=UPI0039E40AE0
MRIRRSAAIFAAFLALGSAAQASPGFTSANVNMRTGPDTEFPSVGVIPEGDPVDVRGCLRDESWCDVLWGGNRGWVYSEYLGFDYRGQTTLLPDVGIAAFGIPVVAFVASDYWNRYYVGRPWYADRQRWFGFKVYARPGWRPPPPGPRAPGWWRSGYRAPSGMKPPPGPGWHRPDRPRNAGPGRDDRRHDDRRPNDRRPDDRR